MNKSLILAASLCALSFFELYEAQQLTLESYKYHPSTTMSFNTGGADQNDCAVFRISGDGIHENAMGEDGKPLDIAVTACGASKFHVDFLETKTGKPLASWVGRPLAVSGLKIGERLIVDPTPHPR